MTASSAPLRLGVSLSNEAPVQETVDLVRLAEDLGIAEVSLPESRHGRGVFTVASQVAAATNDITIGIGIVNPFWRHPSLIAMEAAALDEASGGRVHLGVGAALWTLRSLGEADPRTERPLTAMRETLQILRSILSDGEGIDGNVFTVRSDASLDFEPLRRSIPLYVGAVNAGMLEAAGALADGVQLGAITSPGYARWAWEQIEAGARSAGRDPATLDLTSNVLVSVDDDGDAARNAVRDVLAYYLHRVEGIVIDASGADPAEVQLVRDAVNSSGVRAGAALVTDHLIDVFAAAGTPDHVAARLRAFSDAGIRGLLAWYVFGPDRLAGIRQIAADVAPLVLAERAPVTAGSGPLPQDVGRSA
jgi:5,10-methylenetetrahydromethanopterin reductase